MLITAPITPSHVGAADLAVSARSTGRVPPSMGPQGDTWVPKHTQSSRGAGSHRTPTKGALTSSPMGAELILHEGQLSLR